MTTTEIPIERTREHWQKAGGYPANKEDVYAGHAEAQEFEAARGKHVFEYGCGGGSDAMSYLRRGAHVVYADVVHSNVKAAADRIQAAGLDENAFGLPLNESANIPLGDASFDVVSSHGVLHHIIDPLPVLKEFHRLLKPEGLLFCMLYTPHLEHRFGRTIADLMLARKIGRAEAFAWCTDEEGAPYARSYSIEEGKDFLAAGGFRLLKTSTYNAGDFCCFKAERIA